MVAPICSRWLYKTAVMDCTFPAVYRSAACCICTRIPRAFFASSLLHSRRREHDVKGAHRAGMRAVLISEEGGRSPLDIGDAEPDHVIGALSELMDLVERGRG